MEGAILFCFNCPFRLEFKEYELDGKTVLYAYVPVSDEWNANARREIKTATEPLQTISRDEDKQG